MNAISISTGEALRFGSIYALTFKGQECTARVSRTCQGHRDLTEYVDDNGEWQVPVRLHTAACSQATNCQLFGGGHALRDAKTGRFMKRGGSTRQFLCVPAKSLRSDNSAVARHMGWQP